MTAPEPRHESTAALLDIDVDAEVRKLCGRQFDRPEWTALALVRLLMRFGATAVKLRCMRHELTLSAPAAALPEELLRLLAAVIDAGRSSSERHSALLAAEKTYGVAVLGILAVPRGRLGGGDGASELLWGTGSGPTLRPAAAPLCSASLHFGRVRLAPQMLAEALRHARRCVWLNGRRVDAGPQVSGALVAVAAATDAETAPSGHVALLPVGRLAHVTVVREEVVVEERTAFVEAVPAHASVWYDPAPQWGLAQLQELAAARTAALLERARGALNQLPAPSRQRVANVLVDAARQQNAPSLLQGAAVFQRLDRSWGDLAALMASARQGELWAVAPGEARRWGGSGREAHIWIVEETLKETVAELTRMRVVSPPKPPSVWHRGRELVRRLRERIRATLVAAFAAPPLPEEAWSPELHLLVRALRAELEAGRLRLPATPARVSRAAQIVVVARGRRPTSLGVHGAAVCLRLVAPHPVVRQVAAALSERPADIYVLAPVLFEGADVFAECRGTARQRWLRGESPRQPDTPG